MNESAPREFQIGLTMSGAISAGAYTAGVFDFLIQALEDWEVARILPGNGVASHHVGIKVLSGASAGAITAAVGTIALADQDSKPVYFDNGAGERRRIKYFLPKLYDTWVVKPTLVAEKSDELDFLSLTDVDGTPLDKAKDFSGSYSLIEAKANTQAEAAAKVVSLLNARLLDAVAESAITVKALAPPRPYIAQPFHVYMTLSNLRGIPYEVSFTGGNFHMISHGDRVHYEVHGLGTWKSASDFAGNDQKRPIDTAELLKVSQNALWRDFSICALASGAFPVGLAPRAISAKLSPAAENEYEKRRFPSENLVDCMTISPKWQKTVVDTSPFYFTSADGGIIDNDPFQYARFSLKDEGKLKENIEASKEAVDRAVIMISPFPDPTPIRPTGKPASDIFSILSALLPSLIHQVRFKPDELVLAVNPDHRSRYLIGPKRTVIANGQEYLERFAIASGLLGGFGGFLAREFRDHDFQLGRRNCQRFLRETFVLPGLNPVMGRTQESDFPIIPLFGSSAADVMLPVWPRISQDQLETIQRRIGQRFDCIAPLLVGDTVKGVLGGLIKLLLVPGIRNIPGLVRDKVLRQINALILADLVRRDQILGWELGPLAKEAGLDADDVRAVFAQFLNPNYEFRTASAIAQAIGMGRLDGYTVPPTASQIEALLDRAKTAPTDALHRIWEGPSDGGPRCFTLASRKPSLVKSVLSKTGISWFQPAVQ